MLLNSSTYKQQSLLAEYTRTGNEEIISQLKGVKRKGIQYYRHLIFNIIWDGISNAYPIMTDFFGEDEMKQIVSRFFSKHNCQNSQVWAMPKEFMEYVLAYEKEWLEKHPFLPDLMLIEWKEIELYMMPDKNILPFKKKGSLKLDKLVINPEMEIFRFQYPVHILHPNDIKEEMKSEYLVLLHRDFETKEIIFTSLTEMSEKVIRLLLEEALNIKELQQKSGLLKISDKNKLESFLLELMEREIILGFLIE